MAIIDSGIPADYDAAQDDLWYMAESDLAADVDFKYIFDLYIGNRQLIRAKVYPDPATKKGYFNATNVIGNEMVFDWFQPDGNFVMKNLNDSGECSLACTYRIGEESAGVATLNLLSGTNIVINTAASLFERGIQNKYTPNSDNKFLTNRDKDTTIDVNESFYIGVIHNSDESLIRVSFLNSSGTQIASGDIILNDAYLNVKQLDIGIKAIEDALGFSMPSNTAAYRVILKNSLNSTVYDSITLNLECVPKYDTINLHFMNAYGTFDTARFNYASRLTMDAERKTFEKPDYRFGNYVTHSQDYNTPQSTVYRKYYETKINYGSKFQWNYKLTMNFPSDTDYQWLAELIQSPVVYAQINLNGNSEFYPVGIKATNYEYSTHLNNRLRAFELDIDMNVKRYGFRR